MEKKTLSYDCHIQAEGKIVSFAGYLPLHSIKQGHSRAYGGQETGLYL